ncbi:hypothetical protein CFR75_16440 [Komagataeibacter xylinus]|uniref:Glycosyltransferase 2-like domain-containing protein n=1 Tax=Komagataeibacter xylinus TaxID=28448 RepID=A0A318PE66_KOMXY|nr:glycosyltransferase family 2 protein [Komagataeibacter xylinus]PYD55459.1 hypothetical protein CFR75_16440 [Komagataeibacter xylinus]GBQ70949.1 hypothetical protein AA15237_0973 [Komagataeibacter xylinus NBRC 15237]
MIDNSRCCGEFEYNSESRYIYGWILQVDTPAAISIESKGMILAVLETQNDAISSRQYFSWHVPAIVTMSRIPVHIQVRNLITGEMLDGPTELPSSEQTLTPRKAGQEPEIWPHGLMAICPPGLIEAAEDFWVEAPAAAGNVRVERTMGPTLPGAAQWAIRILLAKPAKLVAHQRIPSSLLSLTTPEEERSVRIFLKLSHALENLSQRQVSIYLSYWDGHHFEQIRRLRRSRIFRNFSFLDIVFNLEEDEIPLQQEGYLILTVEVMSCSGFVLGPVMPSLAVESTRTFEDGRLDSAFRDVVSLSYGHQSIIGKSISPILRKKPNARNVMNGNAFPFTQIIVPVYNGAEVVRDCIDSVLKCTDTPFQLLIIDDGSRDYSTEILYAFCQEDPRCIMHRRDINRGYTKSINEAIKLTSADWVVILNSDTVVSPGWLRRLHMAARSDASIGMVGPLSNAATWQSLPEVKKADGSWSTNDFINADDVSDIQNILSMYSECEYPRAPLLNGFSTLINRKIFDIVGLFDEEAFPIGYGEETDMCLRAIQAGFDLVIADDCFVYHQKSVSFGSASRSKLSRAGNFELRNKHIGINIKSLEGAMQQNKVMIRLRANMSNLEQELS